MGGIALPLRKYGGGGIRTHGRVAPSAVFKTAPFDRSGTPPDLLSKRISRLLGPLPSAEHAESGVRHSVSVDAVGVPEAQLKQVDEGLIVDSDGWFVLNARAATWVRSQERGQDTDFEGKQEWTQLGFRIQILDPGQRGMYHRERARRISSSSQASACS